jgi:hypothetical protein
MMPSTTPALKDDQVIDVSFLNSLLHTSIQNLTRRQLSHGPSATLREPYRNPPASRNNALLIQVLEEALSLTDEAVDSSDFSM